MLGGPHIFYVTFVNQRPYSKTQQFCESWKSNRRCVVLPARNLSLQQNWIFSFTVVSRSLLRCKRHDSKHEMNVCLQRGRPRFVVHLLTTASIVEKDAPPAQV